VSAGTLFSAVSIALFVAFFLIASPDSAVIGFTVQPASSSIFFIDSASATQ
jgi:hypothetical protein